MKSTCVITIAQHGPSDQRINGSDWRVFTKLDQGDWGQRFSFHAARRVSGTHVSRRPASEWAPHVGCADSPEAIADRWIRSTVQIEARPSKLSRTEPLVLTILCDAVHPSGVHPHSSNGKWPATCLINIPANNMVTRGMYLVK